MKTAAKIVAGLAVLGLLAWTGAYLYWHVTILGALRTIETQSVPGAGSRLATPEHREAVDKLWSAGCRGLPYAAGALEPSRNPEFLSSMSHFICWQSLHPGAATTDPGSDALSRRIEEWMISSSDGAAERRAKCERIRTWWAAEGGAHHQWWRVWSKSCGK
jgi:hypothetical protein